MTQPRIAIQVSGLPRFCRETTDLIHCWHGALSVDWYLVLNHSQPDTYSQFDPQWLTQTEDQIALEFQRHLPMNHRLRLCVWQRPDELAACPYQGPGFYSTPENAWQSYKMAQITNTLRRFLARSEQQYDLIVRARLDAAPDTVIDTETAAALARQFPNSLAINSNQRQTEYQFSDQIIWGTEQAMNLVADSVDWWTWAHSQGIPWNPEWLTGHVLRNQGLYWPPTDWNSTLRSRGHQDAEGKFWPDPGDWSLNSPTTLVDNTGES